jgi:hypothetical protein
VRDAERVASSHEIFDLPQGVAHRVLVLSRMKLARFLAPAAQLQSSRISDANPQLLQKMSSLPAESPARKFTALPRDWAASSSAAYPGMTGLAWASKP